jgi:hypothetical protein
MQHIEKDECQVISVTDFQQQRAERQIHKDTWVNETLPHVINPSTWDKSSRVNMNAHTDLLDYVAGLESAATTTMSASRLGPIPSQAQFPNLPDTTASKPTTVQGVTEPSVLGAKPSSNLIDLNSIVQPMSKVEVSHQRSWNVNRPSVASSAASPTSYVHGWLDKVKLEEFSPDENTSDIDSLYDRKKPASDAHRQFHQVP